MFDCVLRVSGNELVIPKSLVVAGEPKGGANIEVTGEGSFEFQVAGATKYLSEFNNELRQLIDSSSSGDGELDFGVEMELAIMKSYCFPAKLIALAGQLNIFLRVSTYAVDDT